MSATSSPATQRPPSKEAKGQAIVLAIMASALLALGIACAVLAFERPSASVKQPSSKSRSGFCARSKRHARCVKIVELEKRRYAHLFLKEIWDLNPEADREYVMFQEKLNGEYVVCATKVKIYREHVVILGFRECGPNPAPRDREGKPITS